MPYVRLSGFQRGAWARMGTPARSATHVFSTANTLRLSRASGGDLLDLVTGLEPVEDGGLERVALGEEELQEVGPLVVAGELRRRAGSPWPRRTRRASRGAGPPGTSCVYGRR